MREEDAGHFFQEKTKYIRGKLGGLRREKWPGKYKSYPGASRIDLPQPQIEAGPSLWTCILKRRSVRDFRDQPITRETLSRLLWASQGITSREAGFELRAAPSAGALYPVETYLIASRVAEIPAGIYHYAVPFHALELLRSGDYSYACAQAGLDQDFMATAAVIFIWTAIFARSCWKYRERAYRYIYLDAGHIAQNLALAAVACGLGSCQVGAFYDEEVNYLIGVDGREESAIYLSAVGLPW